MYTKTQKHIQADGNTFPQKNLFGPKDNVVKLDVLKQI